MKNEITTNNDVNNIYNDIKVLINCSKNRIYSVVNKELLNLYWNIGKIIMDIQEGKNRAKYGDKVLKELSERLTNEFGNGFSKRNLEYMRRFYKMFPIVQSVISQLSWTHYLELMKIKEKGKRDFYMNECINSRWSVRELQRQIKSKLYDRLIINNDKDKELKLTNKGLVVTDGRDLLKDPYILEFLNLNSKYTEKELENKIIEHLKEFLLELGRGYSLVGRQVRITIDNNHYYPDLIFYNNEVKSYLIVDLKIGKLKPQDIGQMLMYVNYYDVEIKKEEENKTIGLLLCADKNSVVVKYTIPKDNNVFVSKYSLHLPTKEELTKLIKKEFDNS